MSSTPGVPTPQGQPAAAQGRTVPVSVPARRVAAASPFMQKNPRFARARPNARQPTSGTQSPAGTQSSSRMTSHPNSAIAAPTSSSQPPTSPGYVEFPIVISKADLGRNARFHGIRFQSKANSTGIGPSINPFAEEQFTRPLRLHRRYTRDKQKGVEVEQATNGVDDKEREAYNARRAERQAEREANQALIAPSGATKKPQVKRKKNQKGVEDVYYDDKDPRQQKAAQLRYEETKPWHLEDFDGKNVWVGSYQEPLSENSVLFSISADAFTMVPVERWYTFRQTDKIAVMNSEDVEKHMSKRYLPGRWYMKTQDQNDEDRKHRATQARRVGRGGATVGGDDDDDVKPKRAAEDAYRADLDELDFEAKDEFQDDDEGLIFGEEEDDAREVEKRVREEMREANLPATNMKNDDKDWDEEEDKEKEEQKAQRKQQKRLRKRIVKHEKKYEYDSDSDHPYSESSDDEDSEEERQRLEEERKKEESLRPSQTNGGRSGVSTPGNNTPAGRSEKHDRSRLNNVLGASLKRPGSPSLSDVSGTESRKKAKGLNGRAISSSNLAGEGARSPFPRHISGHGSGSDTDTSRPDRAKQKRKLGTGSRGPGSPDRSQPGSRAQSPTRSGTPPPRMPSVEEIAAAIPPNGISIKELGAIFKARVSKDKTREFIALIKNITTQDPVTKLLKLSNKTSE